MDKKTIISVFVIFSFFAKGETLKCFKCMTENDGRCEDPTNNEAFLLDCNSVVSIPQTPSFLACSTITYRGLNNETLIDRNCNKNENLCENQPTWDFPGNLRGYKFYSCDNCFSDGCNKRTKTQLQNQADCGKGGHCNGSSSFSSSIFFIILIPFSCFHIFQGIKV